MSKSLGRLWVVSNRVPSFQNGASSGGLVTALAPLFDKRASEQLFQKIILCGYADKPVETAPTELNFETIEGYSHVERALLQQSEKEYQTGYMGYLTVKWALAHGLPDKINPDAIEHYAANRERVRRFAQAMRPHIQANDVIWVHDYHFEELAHDLRSMGVENRIGHFSHITKERASDFWMLPEDIRKHLEVQENNVIREMLAYNMIGFQRGKDLAAFREHMGTFGEIPPLYDVQRVSLFGRVCNLGVFPASIDADLDAIQAAQSLSEKEKKAIDASSKIHPRAARVIWGGRADISKNFPRTFDVVTEVLSDKSFVRKLKLQQRISSGMPIHAYGISTPTRNGVYGYEEEREAIAAAHARLTKEHGEEIATLNEKGLPRDTLLRLYRTGTGMFLSHRDGQLLGVFEHQAAQDPSNPYPVIVSSEAGAADIMPGALVVNPHDHLAPVNALKHALTATMEERRNRHAANMRSLRNRTARRQIISFVRHLTANPAGFH